ncbi:MAG: GGDEF domain-containing protein, partial [Spirochaetales bacterium]|nr:GGDEF domain-containing protein [Spirochaetales bacterium]
MKAPQDICLAFLLNDFHNEYTASICKGVLKASEELGISIVAFGVGALESPVLNTGMRNRLFTIINPDDFQGIIYISSSISNYIGVDRFLDFIKMYGTIPTAHIGIEAPRDMSFNIDNKAGMYSLVDHIIKVHGRKKIAFISGTPGVYEADERFQAYKDALKENGLEFDDRYVYNGNFLRERGILAVEEFLDARKIEMDALVGANDHMALYAMKELQKRGYRIPEDISIGGFDDLASARSHKPALTTVNQPAEQLGYTCLAEFARKIMSGGEPCADIRLPSQLVVRQSCGCPPVKLSEQQTESDHSFGMSLSEMDELNSVLNIMTRNIIGTFEEHEIRSVLDESLNILDIHEFMIAKYVDAKNSLVFYSTNWQTGNKFPTHHLVETKIESFSRPFQKFVLPLFYRDENIGFFVSDKGSKNLSVLEVIRDHLSGAMKGARLLEDVRQYAGRLEKEVEARTRELANRQRELEIALNNVSIAREKLERLAVMDELTGLYNRRGFMTVANQQVNLIHRRENDVLLVFLDLDGLKHINDNFGHASGDIAIKAFADILVSVFRNTDIIGRLGGDEFTVLAIDCTIDEYDTILKRMENAIHAYNQTGKQEFTLSVSTGAAPYKPDSKFTLDELLEEADAQLYKMKKKKKS